MKKVILTQLARNIGALALVLSIASCNTPKPEVDPLPSPANLSSAVVTPTPKPTPSIWANLGHNIGAFNSGVATVWSSEQVQAVVQAASPVALQAISDYASNGGKLSSQQGAALVLQGATVLAPTITSNTQLQQIIITAAVQGAGNNSVKQLATTIGHAVAGNLPKEVTSVQAAQAISAAGTLIIAENAATHPLVTPTPVPTVTVSLTTPAVTAIPTPSPTPAPTTTPTPTITTGLTERHYNLSLNRAI